MHDLIKKITGSGIVITDGAWGTELQKRGLKPGENPDAWNISKPHVVEEIPREYVNAGSQIILTNTFGANRFILKKFGLAEKAWDINRAGAEISKNAAGGRAYVFGSIGPTGKILMKNETAGDDLIEAFDEQARALLEGGADGIVIETMMDMREAAAAVRAAKRTGLPVVACVVFDAGKEKDRTMMGDTVEGIVESLSIAGADAIGANCGQGISGFIPICRRMRSLTGLPLWMKPNAGLPSVVNGAITYKTEPHEFAEGVLELKEAGANFIGGCCGTNPEFIQAIAKMLASYWT